MNINFTFPAKYKVMGKEIWCNAIGFGKWGRGQCLGIWMVSRGKKKFKPYFLLNLAERNRWILVQLNIYWNFNSQSFTVKLEQGHLDHLLPLRLREHLRRKGRRKGGCSVMLSSGHGIAIASMISQQTQAPATEKPREEGVINFSCVVTGETTRLH